MHSSFAENEMFSDGSDEDENKALWASSLPRITGDISDLTALESLDLQYQRGLCDLPPELFTLQMFGST